MNKYISKYISIVFLFLFFVFFSCGSEKAIIKKEPLSLKDTSTKISPLKSKSRIKIKKRYDITQDLYRTRLLLFEKLYQYKKGYQLKGNIITLLEAKRLKDESLRYFLLEDYKKANYSILEALDLLENH